MDHSIFSLEASCAIDVNDSVSPKTLLDIMVYNIEKTKRPS